MVTDFGDDMHCQFLEILRSLLDSYTLSGGQVLPNHTLPHLIFAFLMVVGYFRISRFLFCLLVVLSKSLANCPLNLISTSL